MTLRVHAYKIFLWVEDPFLLPIKLVARVFANCRKVRNSAALDEDNVEDRSCRKNIQLKPF